MIKYKFKGRSKYDLSLFPDALYVVRNWERLTDGTEAHFDGFAHSVALNTIVAEVWIHLRRYPPALDTYRLRDETPTAAQFEEAVHLPIEWFISPSTYKAEDIALNIDESDKVETMTASEADTLYDTFSDLRFMFSIDGVGVSLWDEGGIVRVSFPFGSRHKSQSLTPALTSFDLNKVEVYVPFRSREALEYAETL